jgi:hypothetical protein
MYHLNQSRPRKPSPLSIPGFLGEGSGRRISGNEFLNTPQAFSSIPLFPAPALRAHIAPRLSARVSRALSLARSLRIFASPVEFPYVRSAWLLRPKNVAIGSRSALFSGFRSFGLPSFFYFTTQIPYSGSPS